MEASNEGKSQRADPDAVPTAAANICLSEPLLASSSARCRPWRYPREKRHRTRCCIAFFAILVVIVVITAPTAWFLVRRPNGSTGSTNDQNSTSDPSRARVNLGYAQYQGTILSSGVNQYLGMRYAAPPTGNLRWRAPAVPQSVIGYQDATAFGPICFGVSFSPSDPTQSEDCLYINVWAPTNATRDSKLPVWVFIQGGGYTSDANGGWNGSVPVAGSGNNVVWVQMNYRVALWGFLASQRLAADGDLNVGLLDQRFAMQWIQDHIVEFGGDPNHVVLDGVSAGAGSVAMHLAAYGGKNQSLFHGAIAESTFFPTQPYVSELEWQFDLLLLQVGCQHDEKPMTCLRGKDTAILQSFNIPFSYPNHTDLVPPLFYWTPCVDGSLLQDLPYQLYAQGKFVKVPVLFGTANDEGTYFAFDAADKAQAAGFIQSNFPHLSVNDSIRIINAYPVNQTIFPQHHDWFGPAARAYGEGTFTCPTNTIMDAFRRKYPDNPAWSYRYNVQDASQISAGLGVPHNSEVWAAFGIGSVPCCTPPSLFAENSAVVPVMMHYWSSFVRTLNPNSLKLANATLWEQWGPNRQKLAMQSNNFTMEGIPADQQSRCDLWTSLNPSTEQK